ncbi:MAG: hypothetical protein ACR2NU_16470 [Aeoliella sp.]
MMNLIPKTLILFTALLTTPVLAQVEAPAEDAGALNLQVITNPAVRAAMELPRSEPGDYLQATINLLDLDEPALAKQVFNELVALGLDDAQRAGLVNQFGAATLLRLARTEILGPEAVEFAGDCTKAAAANATSPERIGELIKQLGDESDARQQIAVAELAAIGEVAVIPAIQVLANENSTDRQRVGGRAALLRLGLFSTGPLLASLESGNSQLVAEAAELLAALDVPQAAALLAHPAVTTSGGSSVERAYYQLTGQHASIDSAEGLLTRTLQKLEGGVPAFRGDDAGNIVYWTWNSQNSQPVPLVLSSADATLLYRARLADDLSQLRPHIRRYQSRFWRLGIEAARVLELAGEHASDRLIQLSELPAETVDRVLVDALKADQVAPAIAALGVIADRRDPGALVTHDGKPSSTALALKSSHPNVRLAALEAIAAIDSPRPFPGASYVCPVIARFASSTGDREVVAAAPRLDAASTWAGGLAATGFAGRVASTGGEAIGLASERADVELVLIDMAIGSPAAREVVFQLRRYPGTSHVPIGLFARESQYSTARQIAAEHTGVMAFPRPHTDGSLEIMADELSAHLPRDWPTPELRVEQAERAITVMNKLLESNRDFYRLRAAAGAIAGTLRPDRATSDAWAVLAKLGTLRSQRALVEFASTASLGIDHRRAAAKAFAQSIDRFGLLLTSDEIVRQYHLYNRSEAHPEESQQLLGELLDAIEGPRKAQLKSLTSDP